ncbi:MAG: SDR family NAD(P)-dependent oxidoreductase [Alphaproteobacteria bacterium]|nr:SDR family NAD(P)-dependent oxidoreductase [Alphaproteobacteria bacterium]
MPHKWKSAWITGASSGIGKNLAIELAKKDIKVFASARREERLSEISKISENIIPLVMDVTDEKKLIEDTKIFTEDTNNLPDLIILT